MMSNDMVVRTVALKRLEMARLRKDEIAEGDFLASSVLSYVVFVPLIVVLAWMLFE